MEVEKHIDYIIDWLRDQVKISKTKGLLVGISGGIDSAVVANLIHKAMPDRSLGAILPINNQREDIEDGLLVANTCGIKHFILDLNKEHQSLHNKVMDKLQEINLLDHERERVMDANLRARLRMSTLYALGNNLNYLVVGTDNASELYTGYFTKYGDGGVDLLPLANLKKYQVYEWARVLNIPKNIIDKRPSAGLWQGQTDESELGITYKSIDSYLEGMAINEYDRGIIERLHRTTEHKRNMPIMPDWK